MRRTLGSAPRAPILLIVLILLGFVLNAAVKEYFVDCTDKNLFDCMVSAMDNTEQEVPKNAVTAKGAYEHQGKSVNIVMHIPLTGGAVTGTVSGACEGTVSGTFNGKPKGSISGGFSGVCPSFLVNIPAGVEFSGTMDKTAKKVMIRFNGGRGGFMDQAEMTLTYP